MKSLPISTCRELRLREYRNFAELELVFPPEGVALIGDNGEGKTNLIESLYYLEIFRSFRAVRNSADGHRRMCARWPSFVTRPWATSRGRRDSAQ